MTRIDFYITPEAHADARLATACRLADKAFRLGHRVYIHADSAQQCGALDDLLWTFRAGSFVPHAQADAADAADCAVLIGHREAPGGFDDVMVNLAAEVPPFFSRFERVAEVVVQHAEQAVDARERYRFYRDRGYTLNTHRLAGG